MRPAYIFLGILAFFLLPVFSLQALEDPSKALNDIGVTPVLGAQVDPELLFTDGSETQQSLKQLLSTGVPTILVPVYFKCPRLCGLLLTGVTTLLNALELDLGNEYQVLTISFDSSETSQLAQETQQKYRERLSRPEPAKQFWRFFVGDSDNINQLMQQIGFKFSPDGQDFAHTAAIIILTPEGKISQYFTGIEFSAWDVRMALIEAAHGQIGSALDHIFLFCFRFDPTKGKYTLAAFNMMKLGGALTLLFLIALISRLLLRERALQSKAF